MNKKRLQLNIISSIAQVLIMGLTFLFLYKFLLVQIGVEKLGVWSLILATSSIANLANFGITSGLVKFVADYNARERYKDIAKLLFTSFVSMAVFFFFITFLVYLFSKFIITYIVDPKFVKIALDILPYSLLCLLLNALSGVFTSTLEGLQKNYVRNYLYIIGGVILLVVSYFTVPKYNLIGVAIAQLIQSVFIFGSSIICTIFLLKDMKLFQWNWDKKIFKELISYGSKFQVISIVQMMYEPTTKALIAKFGGLSVVGFYEMASKLVNQVRALIVNANQVMIPVIAHQSHTTNDEGKNDLYKKTFSVILLVDVPIVTGIILFSPLISKLWIGQIQDGFIISLYILAISTSVNILCGAAYFSCLGEGKLNMLLVAHIFMGVLNVGLAFLISTITVNYGAVLAWGIALTTGSLIILVLYHKTRNLRMADLFSKEDYYLLLTGVIISVVSMFYGKKLLNYIPNVYMSIVILFCIMALLILPILKNKNVQQLLLKRKITQ